MHSLTVKLTLAFLGLSLASILLVALFSRQATVREFDRLLTGQQQDEFIEAVQTYYQTYGSWQGIMAAFAPARRPLPEAPPAAQPRPNRPIFALVDPSGCVVLPAGQYQISDCLSPAMVSEGVEVVVDDQTVGVVLASALPPELDLPEQDYLARTNRTLLYAALGAILLSLTLGAVSARTLTRSLRELSAAIHSLTADEVPQQVAIRSKDEIGAVAQAFNQMSAEVTRANQLRRQMTADIAHDLRTPLTVLTGYIESLRDGDLPPSPERFETMYQEAVHLQHLIEDLRTLSLADAGELSLNRQQVSPAELLQRAADAFQQQAARDGITLRVETQSDPWLAQPEMRLDVERMTQVLGNLISNALRYTGAGGQIILSARRKDNLVKLLVADDGQGIAPEAIPHIFERFYRADAARQQSDGESGLGLAIARSIVETHGGTISVESQAGHGAKFTINLPVQP